MAKKGDFFFFDPPYENTKGMYYDRFDNEEFVEQLRVLKEKNIKYAFTYDGKHGTEVKKVSVPNDVFDAHFYLDAGHSSFSRMKQDRVHVQESLYLSWKPTTLFS